ncbi:MAG: outer membrane beta-barrel protein [Candidatus Acidiferrum sp.]
MRIRSALIFGIALLFATISFAQDDDHKIEITGDYSYIHANPQNNNIVPTFSLNGGGASGAFFFSKYIGIEGEMEGYGSTTHNFTISNPNYCPSGSCPLSVSGNLFTYNVGPIVKVRFSHFEPFVETMFGGAHSNFYGNLYKNCGLIGCTVASRSPNNNAFDFLIGGGIDIPVGEHIAIRPVQFEYLLTRFGNSFTAGNNNQSNLRYQAGVQFRF